MAARVAMSDGVHTLDFPAEYVEYMHSLGWGIRAAEEPEAEPELKRRSRQ